MKVVAIIPARGGSKRLENKNIVAVLGKPLIEYTIVAALKSKLIDKVVVSTDSEEIAAVAKRCGAEAPFLRPLHLSTDTAHTPPIIQHAVKFLEDNENYHADISVTLQPTSPIRETEDIDKAIRLLVNGGYESVMSVKDIGSCHPWWVMKIIDGKLEPFLDVAIDPFNLESQQLPKAYIPNGSIYVTRTKSLFVKNAVIIRENCGAYVMDEMHSLEVDTQTDIHVIEAILKEMISKTS
jgi:CMP-N-acetylneuraminic acid synthetase